MGIAVYAILCVLSRVAGMGLIRLAGLPFERRDAARLAPAATFVMWSIFLGIGVSLKFPVKDLWAAGWLITLGAAGYELWRGGLAAQREGWEEWMFVVLLPMAPMAAYFGYGLTNYLGSPFPDGWSYVASGQYLWEYPRGAEGGLAPLHQYAAHLSAVRFIASAMMAFFSSLTKTPGDTQAVSAVLSAWVFMVMASSGMFFGASRGLTARRAYLFTGFLIFSAWHVNLLWANNYDNALALIHLPVLAGIIELLNPRDKRWSLVLAGLFASAIYCYPEMTPFVAVCSLALCTRRFVASTDKAAWLLCLLFAVVLTSLLISPFAGDYVMFLKGQYVASSAGRPRPGEGLFGELLKGESGFRAFWGFVDSGPEGVARLWAMVANAFSLILTILAATGLFEMFRRRDWGLGFGCLLLLAGAMYMIFAAEYSYGTYKLILFNWTYLALAVALGTERWAGLAESRLGKRARWNGRRVAACLFALWVVPAFCFAGDLAYARHRSYPRWNIEPLRAVREVANIVGDNGLVIAATEELANVWAVYFLRESSVFLSEYRGYVAQAHVEPLMKRAKAVPLGKIRYILVDNPNAPVPEGSMKVWSGGPYHLWRLPERGWAIISGVRNANGIETWTGQRGFWMGQGDTEISVMASAAGPASLSAWFNPGPSLPERQSRYLSLIEESGASRTVAFPREGAYQIPIRLKAGENRFLLRPLDHPSVGALASGDARPIIVGVRGLEVRLGPE